MNKAYKTELFPNNKQQTMLSKHCDAARFAYNWGLDKRSDLWKNEKKSTNAQQLHKEIVQLKQTELSWLYDVSKCAVQESLRDLDVAFKNFFRKLKQKKKGKAGFPKFKSRKNDHQSYRVQGCIEIDSKSVKIPRIGWIRLKEESYLPVGSDVKSLTISTQSGRWFVSASVEENPKKVKLTKEVIGIDLGIKTLATCSNGLIFDNPKALRKRTKQLRKCSKRLSRKVKGSNNRNKARIRLNKLHYRIANIRKDVLHKITTAVARTKPKAVVMENLVVQNMAANRRLSRSILDCGFFEFRRQLEYKLKWIGSEIILADTFFPSSKMCSCCGNVKKELSLSERTYSCEECGFEEDRDLNAAINLKNYGTVGSTGKARLASLQACGDESSGLELVLNETIVCEAGIKQKTCLA